MASQNKSQNNFMLGVRDSYPVCIAFLFMCISFGGLAKTVGLSLMQTMSMAMMIYSIPLQIFLISLAKSNLVLSTIVMLTFVINARFFLMSLSLVHRFKGVSLTKTIPALLILSASSFTVAHVKFLNEDIERPFNYYVGVALSAYVMTFFSTLAGFYIAFINDSVILYHVFSIALAIHFTALTAIRFPNIRLIVATIFGFAMLPLLSPIVTLNINILISPFVVATIMLLTRK
ncbi:MAG: AzlC family ABC transporter permease [Pseudomonadota bacterium]